MAVQKLNSPKGAGAAASAAPKSKADAKAEAAKSVTAHPGLKKVLLKYDGAKKQASSYMIEAATLCQEQQLSKEEIVATLMEVRGIDRETAGQQFSRLKLLLLNPETLEELREGKISLKEAKEKVKKAKGAKTRQLSAKEIQRNTEAVITRSITQMLNAAKNGGTSLEALLSTLKEAAKKAGLK